MGEMVPVSKNLRDKEQYAIESLKLELKYCKDKADETDKAIQMEFGLSNEASNMVERGYKRCFVNETSAHLCDEKSDMIGYRSLNAVAGFSLGLEKLEHELNEAEKILDANYEKRFLEILRGEPGMKKVIKDGYSRTLRHIGMSENFTALGEWLKTARSHLREAGDERTSESESKLDLLHRGYLRLGEAITVAANTFDIRMEYFSPYSGGPPAGH